MKKVLLSVLTLLTISGNSIAQNLPSYLPANGLVGWWPFNGNANDESGNNNNGTVSGATLTINRFGNSNHAYFFNGQSSEIQYIGPDFGNSDFSISGWFKTSANVPISNYSQIYMGGYLGNTTGASVVEIGIASSSVGSNYLYYYNRDQLATTATTIQSTSPVNDNNWWHFSAVRSFGTMKLFLDGILVDSTNNGPTGDLLDNGVFKIGNGQFNTANRWFFGSLDDIAIYNRALSQQEITALYNATNCANNLSINPTSLNLTSGSPASFTATTTDPNPVYSWQSDLGLGFQDLSNYGQYSGVGSNNLQVAGLQLRNHQQKFRVISTSGNCVDTSAVATIALIDTCINVVNDTNFITVTDTLRIIITAASGLVQNTLKAYPNPTAGMLFINTGNYAVMPGYSIRISSATGQEVYNSEVNQQLLQVPLENLSPEGLFYLRLYDASGTLVTTRKIVLQ